MLQIRHIRIRRKGRIKTLQQFAHNAPQKKNDRHTYLKEEESTLSRGVGNIYVCVRYTFIILYSFN